MSGKAPAEAPVKGENTAEGQRRLAKQRKRTEDRRSVLRDADKK